MASKGVIQNRLSQPLGSKYLSATDHTEVNCTEFVTQEDTIITLLEGGDASVAATDVDYKSSMNLDGVTLKKGALIVSPAGEAFQNINISQGSVLAYNSVFKGEKPGSFIGLLDLYPDAAAAYSLRKLRADYVGAAIEVRIDTAINPQPTYDIGFDSDGNLDTADLLSKAGSDDAYVAVWYDQSGGGNDATQGSASAQPQIVNSGSINLQNGEPCAVFDGVDDFLTLGVGNSLDYSENNIYSFSVNKNNGSVNGRIWADDIIGTQGYIINRPYLGVNGVFINDGNGYESASNTPATSGINSLSTLAFNGTTGIAISRQNGAQYESKTVSNWAGTIGSSGSAGFAIGSGADGGQYFDGNQQSLIIYTSNEASNLSGIETNINKYYNIYWDGSQTGLLDDYPNASAAYSLRALNSSYTGPAISVRRSSDNAVQDIKLLYDGELDTEGLLSFVGAGDGFVTAWYDQSISGIDFTQTSAVNQPQIVDSGALITTNLKPSIKFNGTSNFMDTSVIASTVLDSNSLASVVFESQSISDIQGVFYEQDVSLGDRRIGIYSDTGINEVHSIYRAGTSPLFNNFGSTQPTNTQRLLTLNRSSNDVYAYAEGVLIDSVNSSETFANSTNLELGWQQAGSLYFGGNIQEAILFSSSLNRTGIETNINDYYSVYE